MDPEYPAPRRSPPLSEEALQYVVPLRAYVVAIRDGSALAWTAAQWRAETSQAIAALALLLRETNDRMDD